VRGRGSVAAVARQSEVAWFLAWSAVCTRSREPRPRDLPTGDSSGVRKPAIHDSSGDPVPSPPQWPTVRTSSVLRPRLKDMDMLAGVPVEGTDYRIAYSEGVGVRPNRAFAVH